jgi:hypothetical protein
MDTYKVFAAGLHYSNQDPPMLEPSILKKGGDAIHKKEESITGKWGTFASQ